MIHAWAKTLLFSPSSSSPLKFSLVTPDKRGCDAIDLLGLNGVAGDAAGLRSHPADLADVRRCSVLCIASQPLLSGVNVEKGEDELGEKTAHYPTPISNLLRTLRESST